ncbi:hypothetical protein NB703_000880 [Pantoea ananatis]|uniref:Uncharacterized protein n=1 Tax=Pantoea ananas TaxID=553 RepID=A0AAJ1CWF7_PANAN|nr:hypothetical protein [Pantoea ananatis]
MHVSSLKSRISCFQAGYVRSGRSRRDVRCYLIKICNAFDKNISILRSKMIKYNLLFDEIKRCVPLAYYRPVYPCLRALWG